MRCFKDIIKDISKLGSISKDNIDIYISLMKEAKDNLLLLKELDISKAKKNKKKEVKELLKNRKKYLKNEEKINSLYDYYTSMESGIKTSGTGKIIYERYYLCKLEKDFELSEYYKNIYDKYFININNICHLILNNKLVPVIIQDMYGLDRELISGKYMEDLACDNYIFTKMNRINRGQLVDKLKIMDQEDIRSYRDKINDFQNELDMLKYHDGEKESVLRFNN